MSMVRQFRTAWEFLKPFPKKLNGNGLGHSYLKGYTVYVGFHEQGLSCTCLSMTFLSLALKEKRKVFSICTSLK